LTKKIKKNFKKQILDCWGFYEVFLKTYIFEAIFQPCKFTATKTLVWFGTRTFDVPGLVVSYGWSRYSVHRNIWNKTLCHTPVTYIPHHLLPSHCSLSVCLATDCKIQHFKCWSILNDVSFMHWINAVVRLDIIVVRICYKKAARGLITQTSYDFS